MPRPTASRSRPSRRRPPTRRSARGRRPSRAASRRRTTSGSPARLGLLIVLLVLAGALVSPQGRRVADRVLRAGEAATAEARRDAARRRVVAAYASRYGITLELADDVERIAREEGIDPELGFRLVRVESGFQERAVSSAGALGLTQLMPGTAAEMEPAIDPERVFDRETNLRLGFRYLHWLIGVHGGDVEEALHAYNRGPGTVARIRAAGGDPANGYAELVLGEAGARPVRRSAAGEEDEETRLAFPRHEMAPARLRVGGG